MERNCLKTRRLHETKKRTSDWNHSISSRIYVGSTGQLHAAGESKQGSRTHIRAEQGFDGKGEGIE